MGKVGSKIHSEMNCKTAQELLSKAHSLKHDKYRAPGGCDEGEINKALEHLLGCEICKDWFVHRICIGKMIGCFEGDFVVPYIHSKAHDLLHNRCSRLSSCPW